MVNFFDCLYRAVSGNASLFGRIGFHSLIRFFIRWLANCCLPNYFLLTKKDGPFRLENSAPVGASVKVVVSLTTFPGRIDTVWLSIETLLRQSLKPDAIVLWLSSDQFNGLADLPSSLLALVDRGLRIELREGDLRSHKKYYYARKEFPHATLVLADDDIFYPTTMLRDLVELSRQYEGRVICRFAKKIQWAESGQLTPYIEWKKINEALPREDIFFGSGGGVLIPPGAMHEDILNIDAFIENCPLADDIWLNAMCRLVSPVMVSTATPFSLLPVISHDKSDLSSVNNGQLMNDRQLGQVIAYCKAAHGVNPFAAK